MTAPLNTSFNLLKFTIFILGKVIIIGAPDNMGQHE